LSVATKDQLFQFNGQLYQQIDGVAMESKNAIMISSLSLNRMYR